MTSSSEDGREGSWAAVLLRVLGGLVLLALVYGGAYLALVERHDRPIITFNLTPKTSPTATLCALPTKGDLTFAVRAPPYRWGGNAARTFFAPAFAIDRRIRPTLWEFKVE